MVYLIRGGSIKYPDNLKSVWNPDGQKVTSYYARGLNDPKSAWMTCKMCSSKYVHILPRAQMCLLQCLCVFPTRLARRESLRISTPKIFPRIQTSLS